MEGTNDSPQTLPTSNCLRMPVIAVPMHSLGTLRGHKLPLHLEVSAAAILPCIQSAPQPEAGGRPQPISKRCNWRPRQPMERSVCTWSPPLCQSRQMQPRRRCALTQAWSARPQAPCDFELNLGFWCSVGAPRARKWPIQSSIGTAPTCVM